MPEPMPHYSDEFHSELAAESRGLALLVGDLPGHARTFASRGKESGMDGQTRATTGTRSM